MARIRTVKPELFRHTDLFEAERASRLPLRLCFIGLLGACDREGRFRWNARELKLDIAPYDEFDFSRVLDALLEHGFIAQYRADDGRVYGCIPSWHKNQYVNGKEGASQLPEPPPSIVCAPHRASLTRKSRDASNARGEGEEEREEEVEMGGEEEGMGTEFLAASACVPDASASLTASAPLENQNTTSAGYAEEETRAPQLSNPSNSSTQAYSFPNPFITLPLDDGKPWHVHHELVDDWQRLYPQINVEQALRSMRAWLDANPERRKSARGMKGFAVNWLQRERKESPKHAQRGPRGTTPPDLANDAALNAQIARLTAAANASANDAAHGENRHA